MRSSDLKRKLLGVGVFIAPILLVNATRVFFSRGGPAEASAAPQAVVADTDTMAFPTLHPPAPGEKVARAAEHVEQLRGKPFGATPLYYEPDRVSDKPDPKDQGPKQDPVPDLNVRAILSSATGDIALIGSEAHREGDTVLGTEWVVVGIDAVKRSVVLEHPPTGRTIECLVVRPRN